MARKLSNFLDSYMEFARDEFVPDKFHLWAGLSILAGAVERKITLKQGHIQYVPNIYVMLVSHPKGGKSTAIIRAADFLEELKERSATFRLLPNQMTEPAFIDLMKIVDHLPIPGRPTLTLAQSAGFFYASEASSSALKETDGFIVAAFTDFWDCPKKFRKKLKTESQSVEIDNACLNVLAGTTFHFLKSLVNENSVLGGFASRLIYVVSPERKVRSSRWLSEDSINTTLRNDLMNDLEHIHNLMGPMTPTEGWIKKYEEWQPEFDKYLIGLESPRLEGIMARKDTNLIKVSMLMSLAESDSLTLEERHFDKALAMIEDVYKDNASIVAAAAMSDRDTQYGLNQTIGQLIKAAGGTMNMTKLRQAIIGNGNDIAKVDGTIEFMVKGNYITINSANGLVTLLEDPDRHL